MDKFLQKYELYNLLSFNFRQLQILLRKRNKIVLFKCFASAEDINPILAYRTNIFGFCCNVIRSSVIVLVGDPFVNQSDLALIWP